VQQDTQAGYTLISPKPAERTASAYRFELAVPANGGQILQVELERVNTDTVAAGNATPDTLVEIVSGKQLSEAGRSQLEAVVALKRKVAAAEGAMEASKSSLDDLTQDQTRLRQNIDSLNKVSGQEDKVRQYSTRLNDNEVKLAEIRDRQNELKQNLSALNAELADAVRRLRF
jgi:chromosome segregation ATPase